MKYILNNSFLNLNKLNKEIGIYNNYFIYNIENNLGNYIYINKIIKKNVINLKKNIYFFKDKKINIFFKNFKQSILSVFYGFFVELLLVGLGYKIIRSRKLNNLNIELHFSHQLIYKIPLDIVIKTSKKNIIIFGLDKQKVKNISQEIINLRFPNIYKGKGIRYLNQVIKLKPGKQR